MMLAMKKTPLQRAQDQSFGHVLFECARLLDTLAQAEVNRQAGTRVARPALMRLLPHLDFEGVRTTELAKRVDVTKQAVSHALGELEAQGLVEYTPDPADGRAQLVRLTKAGGAAFTHGLSVLATFERALATEVGAARLKATLKTLQAVREALERRNQP